MGEFIYDPEAAYNFTSTALLAVLVLVGFTSILSFYMLRVYPQRVKIDERRLAMDEQRVENDLKVRLAEVEAAERNRQAEIIQIEGRLTQLRDAVIRYQEAVILKLEEIEDNRLDEVTAFVKQALQVPSND